MTQLTQDQNDDTPQLEQRQSTSPHPGRRRSSNLTTRLSFSTRSPRRYETTDNASRVTKKNAPASSKSQEATERFFVFKDEYLTATADSAAVPAVRPAARLEPAMDSASPSARLMAPTIASRAKRVLSSSPLPISEDASEVIALKSTIKPASPTWSSDNSFSSS